MYMPYEGDFDNTIEFVNQLSILTLLLKKYQDFHVIVCGNYNVDLFLEIGTTLNRLMIYVSI
jgi:hypothetical protein